MLDLAAHTLAGGPCKASRPVSRRDPCSATASTSSVRSRLRARRRGGYRVAFLIFSIRLLPQIRPSGGAPRTIA